MEYGLLGFDLRISNGILECVNSFSASANMISETPSSDDYEIPDYLSSRSISAKIYDHASWAIHQLRSNSIDERKYKSILARDYYNALMQIAHGIRVEKSKLFWFTELLVQLDMEADIISTIHLLYQLLSETGEKYRQDYLPDFDQLFLKAGDRALFIKHDYSLAIRLYKLCTLQWNYNHTYYSAFSKDDWAGTNYQMKKDFATGVSIFETVLDLDYIEYNKSDWPDYYNRAVLESYISIVKAYRNHLDASEQINYCLELINNTIKTKTFINGGMLQSRNYGNTFSDITFQTYRLASFMVPNFYKIGLVDELYSLSYEKNRKLQTQLEERIWGNLKYLAGTEWQPLFDAYLKLNRQITAQQLFVLVNIIHIEKEIRECLRINTIKQDYAYYTSWDTLSYMMPEKAGDEAGKLQAMHLSYMNDPMEGTVLRSHLFGEKSIKPERTELFHPYVFLKCFTTQVDYLPMWGMYGKNAAGCCVVFDWEETIKKYGASNSIELFRVCYLTKSKDKYVYINKNNPSINANKMRNLLSELEKYVRKTNTALYPFAEKLLSGIAYLFKDSSYSYEEEARLLYSFSGTSDIVQHTDQIPPRLYVKTTYPVAIKEIILGPRFENVSEWIPHMCEQVELMCKQWDLQFPKISISNIGYR